MWEVPHSRVSKLYWELSADVYHSVHLSCLRQPEIAALGNGIDLGGNDPYLAVVYAMKRLKSGRKGPAPEVVFNELRSMVGDQMTWAGPCRANDTAEECSEDGRPRLLREEHDPGIAWSHLSRKAFPVL